MCIRDSSCTFSHPEIQQQGRWFGRCDGGRGAYTGYGLVVDQNGNTVEYLGHAANGVADGTGAMIYRLAAESGAVYFEGSFNNGLPDGIVLVEEPGRKAMVRKYRAGKDAGSADADQLQRLQF